MTQVPHPHYLRWNPQNGKIVQLPPHPSPLSLVYCPKKFEGCPCDLTDIYLTFRVVGSDLDGLFCTQFNCPSLNCACIINDPPPYLPGCNASPTTGIALRVRLDCAPNPNEDPANPDDDFCFRMVVTPEQGNCLIIPDNTETVCADISSYCDPYVYLLFCFFDLKQRPEVPFGDCECGGSFCIEIYESDADGNPLDPSVKPLDALALPAPAIEDIEPVDLPDDILEAFNGHES